MKILDCTLRDGGYCNKWKFGYDNMKKITYGLTSSGVDIIECGFLTDKVKHSQEISLFNKVEEIHDVIPNNRQSSIFICMLNYGEYDINNLPKAEDGMLDGIRIAFHKKDVDKALENALIIKERGYLVFIQPMVTLNYSDEEFLSLIKKCNIIEPYAFYIVDSFGVMKRRDLIRFFYLVEHNLKSNTAIGFHSHNNMQLAYSNAQVLAEEKSKHEIIVDSSVFGMGRGAGNLNTELYVEYLNENNGKEYKLKPLLGIIDEVLTDFYQKDYWGYSLPNYLSAKHNAHPNYANYLDSKKTLTVENMEEIFSMMDASKTESYDEEFVEQLYQRYMDNEAIQVERYEEFRSKIKDKEILLIAPGKSSFSQSQLIRAYIDDKKPIVLSINHAYEKCTVDFIFVSNLRRYRELDQSLLKKCVVTSNIPTIDVYLKVRYGDLVNENRKVRDNAGLMCIKLMAKLNARKIVIAGMDGYSAEIKDNYSLPRMELYMRTAEMIEKNAGMRDALKMLGNEIEIDYLTKPKYIFEQ